MERNQKIARYDVDGIGDALVGVGRFSGKKVHYFDEIGSTNTWLLEQDVVDGCICLAESQSAARGRRGKSWQSPGYGCIALSLGWRPERADMRGMSLVSGIAVMQSLQGFGVQQVALKWPNDILVGGKKAGGILVEISAPNCVIGIGLNYRLPAAVAHRIDQPWTDLASTGIQVERDRLVVELVKNHSRLLTGFDESGFVGFVELWNLADAWRGRPVRAVSDTREIYGTSCGVDETGALLIAGDDGIHHIISGEVSLRADRPGNCR